MISALRKFNALTHCDYLHTTAGDPRRPLAESLLSHIGETGSLIAYNIPFERGVLRDLADHLPEYAGRLLDMADRLWDQLPSDPFCLRVGRFNNPTESPH